MVRGEVTESGLSSQFRGHCRFESRCCNPCSGNEKGPVENAVGLLRRNPLVPVPSVGSMAELNALLPRAYGAGPAVGDPLSPVPAIAARPRAFGESTIGRDMPPGLAEGIDRMDAAGRRRGLRSMERTSATSAGSRDSGASASTRRAARRATATSPWWSTTTAGASSGRTRAGART